MAIPQRKSISHETPDWINNNESIFFITICCLTRKNNQLCTLNISTKIFESIKYRHNKKVWYAHLFLLMPDHLHALLSFPTTGKSMNFVIAEWKRWISNQTDIRWQRDFFDHRLRKDESLQQKADYILTNPIRAG
jgi:putative transposase